MKWLIFAARRAHRVPGDGVNFARRPGRRRASERWYASRVRVAIWRLSRKIIRRVCSRMAGMSEAMNISPLADAERHAARVADPHRHQAIRLVGVQHDNRVCAAQPRHGAPRRFGDVAARRRSRAGRDARSLRCRYPRRTSRRSASSSARSSRKFSTMPLCTTTVRPLWLMCGCALRELGTPCVAQRVCPMPMRPLSGSVRTSSHQIVELAHVAPDGESVILHDGDPGGVVAAIFQALQAVEDDRGCVTRTDITHDSTHGESLPLRMQACRRRQPPRTRQSVGRGTAAPYRDVRKWVAAAPLPRGLCHRCRWSL